MTNDQKLTSLMRGLLACAGTSALWAASPRAIAQDIDMDQFARIMNGEIIEECDEDDEEFTDEFAVEDCVFLTRGANAYWVLDPGWQITLEGDDEGELIELSITVLRQTFDVFLNIDGQSQRIRTRVIEEREVVDGELKEISFNYYARCRLTNDVYYFGERVFFFKDGVIINNNGSWEAGKNGAEPGIIMPGTFLVGARYFQEVAPGIALDRAENASDGETVQAPAGFFDDCVVVEEDTPLEPDSENVKTYAPGIGLINEDDILELTFYGFVTQNAAGDSVPVTGTGKKSPSRDIVATEEDFRHRAELIAASR